jgi:hypothetical protein
MRVDEATGIVLLEGEGPVRFDEWEAQVLSALAHAAGSRRRFLSDRRQLEPAHSFATAEGILDFLRRHAAKLEDAQWVVVADAGSAAYESVKVIEEGARAYRVRVKAFTELGAALPWLLGVYDHAEVERLERWIAGSLT